ncbi:MAG: methionine--tRNA ligase, partial [Chloroflexi bacterium]|nr:methionine--tRNA ligase [Chloroflexota bacterium]
LQSSMALAQAANRYLDQKEPWRAVRQDKQDAAQTLWTTISVINCLKTTLYPFLPFSSQKLHEMLGFDGEVEDSGWKWDPQAMVPGQQLKRPTPLFQKLDAEIIAAEEQRLAE